MPFEIVRNDNVNMQVDAVVNTANPNPAIGSGVDSGIHLAKRLTTEKMEDLYGEVDVKIIIDICSKHNRSILGGT